MTTRFIRRTLVLFVAATFATGAIEAQQPADSVDWAIAEGIRTKKCDERDLGVSRWRRDALQPHEFRVHVSGPVNRAQCRAASIAAAFKVPSRADLTAREMLRMFMVEVIPLPAVETRPDRAEITNIVLRWKGSDGEVIVQPDSLIAVTDTFRNAQGAVIPYTRLIALFAPAHWPDSDLEIVLAIPDWKVSATLYRRELRKIH